MKQLPKIAKVLLDPRANLDNVPHSSDQAWEAPAMAGNQLRLRHITSNFPLMFGGLIVFGLFLMVLFGPLWAPINPYIAGQHVVPHLEPGTGEWIAPPLDPSPEYPLGTDQWGNDILSMLLYGARNTLIAATFITMMRVILGLILGSLAGWYENRPIDRFIMGTSGVLMAVPMLISSMILIYALDIRRGLPVFIVALSVIGWTEIAQYMRSEILVIRKKPYIEGAHAAGAQDHGIVVRHIFPNLLPQLLVLIFLEFGAVLLLMGELAFIGVFIGGGTNTVAGDDTLSLTTQTVADVPEWGAMLAGGYRWFMAKPFIVFPPALAFFVAIIGFNTFGEGLRRLIERTYVNTSFLLKKRMLLVIASVTLATGYIITNTGPAPWFAKMANAFSGDGTYEHTQMLASMNGRSPSQASSTEAAAYIAQKFEAYGLQPGWKHLAYTYPMSMTLTSPINQPTLEIVSEGGTVQQSFAHQLEFGFMIEGHGGSGDVTLPLTFVGFDKGGSPLNWEAYRGLDLRERIVVLQEGNAPSNFPTEALIRGAKGVLWLAKDDDIRSQTQFAYPNQDYMLSPQLPVLRVTRETAVSLLNSFEITQSELLADSGRMQSGAGWFTRDLDGAEVRMVVELEEAEATAVPSVLGYLPGSDLSLASELVVIYAHFDGLGTDPDGTVYPATNHNASGVGVMLEIARLWQEESLDPRRPVLFVAWGAGTLDAPGAREFINAEQSFRHLPTTEQLQPRAVFQLDNAGAGGENLFIHPASSNILTELVSESAAEVGVLLGETAVGETFVSDDVLDPTAPWVYLAWENEPILPDQDTFDRIDAEKLRTFGEVLALSLAKIVRQSRY